MRLVRQTNTTQIIETLEKLYSEAPHLRCIHISLSRHTTYHKQRLFEDLFRLAKDTILEKSAFFIQHPCGDVFVISPCISQEVYKEYIKQSENIKHCYHQGFDTHFLEVGHDYQKIIAILSSLSLEKKTELVEDTRNSNLETQKSKNAIANKNEFDPLVKKSKRKNRKIPLVLVADDDPVTRKIVRSIFLSREINIKFATSGLEALSIYTSSAPDIVLLDIGLPDMSGHDVMKKIMSYDASAQIIMLTSYKSLDIIKKCLNSGASGYIAKPFSKRTLLNQVSKKIFMEESFL